MKILKILSLVLTTISMINVPVFASTIASIEDLFSYSTVQIRTKFGSGTGFFFEFDAPDAKKIPCLITNKHIRRNKTSDSPLTFEDSTEGEITFHLKSGDGKPDGAQKFTIGNSTWRWIDHPEDVDLCAMPLVPILNEIKTTAGVDIFYPSLQMNNLITDEELSKLTPVSNILMVGYPIGLIDDVNNFPIFRTGITASHPGLSFKGKSEFLIDAACWPGSSGSPVFLKGPILQIRGEGRHVGSPLENKLLGVLWGGPQHTAAGEIVPVEIPMVQVPVPVTCIPTNLGFVAHSREILKIGEEILKLLPPSPPGSDSKK